MPTADPSRLAAALGPALDAATADAQRWVDQLAELVRIRSVSAAGYPQTDLRASAEATAAMFVDAGLTNTRVVDPEASHPAVIGSWDGAGPDAPTVLLYAHHDVQPAEGSGWDTDPFTPTVRDGRMFGRGAADDKAGAVAHAAAIAAWFATGDGPPVNLRVFVEGEEEIGSPQMAAFLEQHVDELRSDVMVIADLTNWTVDVPALTTSLRGVALVDITVTAMDQPVHSGMWGGPMPDALLGLMRLVATLHDDEGRVAVNGFHDGVAQRTAAEDANLERLAEITSPADFLAQAAPIDGLDILGGADQTYDRLWWQPSLTVTGIDAPSTATSANQLINTATARLSYRFAPGQNPTQVLDAVDEHLRANIAWGLQLDINRIVAAPGWRSDTDSWAFAAAQQAWSDGFGEPAVQMGCGGSIPFIPLMQDMLDGVPALLVGVEDPTSNPHGDNESIDLAMFAKTIQSEVRLLAELAQSFVA